ncbi:hypothetical protein [Frigidibacter sp. ROC022]|uniref:hypothetical protein n=1 Tax=Frigidibacter sp. ROC022 TaxID=2971796 RepID=UPI00215A21D2|nr:hypothetical protein [Frigidibacter sp. ROC022]MCR8725805.1 hypothetical protein [Frigidibacter sp. ROC022]
MSIFDTSLLRLAGVGRDGPVAEAVTARSKIIEMTQAAEDAVLRPKDFGAFGHDLRSALAARVARLAGDEALAAHHGAAAGQYAALADPASDGAEQELSVILAFVDKAANQTRDIAGADISGLQAAGFADADIVRLCELVAFLAYQLRVISGLRLMNGAAA